MPSQNQIAGDLAAALLGGAWTRRALLRRLSGYLRNKAARSNARLVDEILERTEGSYPPSPFALKRFILDSRAFPRAAAVLLRTTVPVAAVLTPPRFWPAAGNAAPGVPEIETPGDLAIWLGVPISRLQWLADEQRRHHTTAIPMFQNYRYRFMPKASGGWRLIEWPKPHLRAIQVKILREILDRLSVHEAAHGFVRGRSCKTAAAMHAGEAVVACMDIRDFFGSVRLQRIHAIFRRIGYPWAVARLLSCLCVTSTPASVFARAPDDAGLDWETRKRFSERHLPQGAPTSPALANLVVGEMDRRLEGLARHCDARYTRYADDLSFSGDETFARRIGGFLGSATDIVRDEGFSIHTAKTRIMRRGARQVVTGLVVNEHVNILRHDYDTLKAILHNCAKHGAESQNRSGVPNFPAHLAGRIAWVEHVNPVRGARLRTLYNKVAWTPRAEI